MTEELDDPGNAVPASTNAALKATARGRVDDRRYVSAPAFVRSWDEQRALRAYTVNFNPALDAELRADGAERRRAVRHRPGPGATAFDRRVS